MTHARAYELNIEFRNKLKSFLWTGIRHPSNRAISHYGMLRNKNETSVKDFISKMRLETHKSFLSFHSNFQLEFLSPKRILNQRTTNEEYMDIVQDILDEYNFISIYERLDE